MATPAMTAPVRLRSVSMERTVRHSAHRFKSPGTVSAFHRLGQKWGCKPETAKDRVYGERGVYQMVADANEAFLADGLAERVAMLMAVVDASMLTTVPPLEEAIHKHNHSDAVEDVEQALFIRTAGDAELGGWITKLATDIRLSESLLAALVRERETRRNTGEPLTETPRSRGRRSTARSYGAPAG
jgi:hypothetical protein